MSAAKLYRSFCGKSNEEVSVLIAGPQAAVNICGECVGLCDIIVDENARKTASFTGDQLARLRELIREVVREELTVRSAGRLSVKQLADAYRPAPEEHREPRVARHDQQAASPSPHGAWLGEAPAPSKSEVRHA